MSLKIITAPAAEPVSVAEVKAQARVDHSDEDALVAIYIAAARAECEHITERALITQTWELALDAFPSRGIRLARPPFGAIVSVKYDDEAGAEQTLPGSAYTVDSYQEPAWLLPAYGTTWPGTIDAANAVRIRFTAGYGAAGTDVPAVARHWILIQAANAFAHREALVDGRLQVPAHVVHLLDSLRLWQL